MTFPLFPRFLAQQMAKMNFMKRASVSWDGEEEGMRSQNRMDYRPYCNFSIFHSVSCVRVGDVGGQTSSENNQLILVSTK